jgi:hypothetical protein
MFAVGVAGPLSAQVSIRVVDSSGRAIPAVQVDVYGRGEVISTAATTADGVAELSPERWSEARRLSLNHLGYETLIVQIADIPADGVISIEPVAIPLDGVSVAVGRLCPVPDDPDARRLWSEVASLYATDTGSRASLTRLSLSRSSVPEDVLYQVSGVTSVDGVIAGGSGTIHGGDFTPMPLDERVEREGYAWPPLGIDEVSRGWSYPDLELKGAHHFASRAFGALHNFAVANASGDRTTLIFCGNGTATGATINGTISLVPGREFLGAEWRFETADPHEGAGGSVTFASFVGRTDATPHLVSSRGLFYRHSGTEPPFPDLPRTYAREVTTNVRWHVLPSGEQPCVGEVAFWDDSPPMPDSDAAGLVACVLENWGPT